MPTDFAARSQRRPFTLIAVWLVVLQAFVAGLAAARSGAATASDPVVCHGAGEGAEIGESITPLNTGWFVNGPGGCGEVKVPGPSASHTLGSLPAGAPIAFVVIVEALKKP